MCTAVLHANRTPPTARLHVPAAQKRLYMDVLAAAGPTTQNEWLIDGSSKNKNANRRRT
jgi:hypothetical protein